jgi:PAS domain S-box-containing protein
MISVLFVDDNTDLFGQIRSFLEKAGDIRLESAHSIKQAIEKIKGRTYDVIVSYEQIPEVNGIEFVSDMNGIEFLQYLKSEGNTTPVVLICRRGNNKLAAEEITIAAEIRLPKNGDIRPNLAELVTLIKQTMLRRKAERELKVQNEQLTTILSATPLGIFQVRNNIVTWTNHQFARMLGYEESHLIGKDIHIFFKTPEDFDLMCRELQFTKNSQGSPQAECRFVKKDSGSLACQVEVQMNDPRDISQGGTFIVTDISEKKKIADALKESEAKYREVLTNTQSIIIRMDMQGIITFFNNFALSFFDYSSEDVIGKNVIGTIVPQKIGRAHV